MRRDASDPTAVRLFTMQTFLCRRETGELGGIEGSIRGQVTESPALGSWQCLLAVHLAETGRFEEARTILDALAPDDFGGIRRDFNYPPSLALLAIVASLLEDAGRAKALYRLLEPFAERNIVFPVYCPGALGSAHRHLGPSRPRKATRTARPRTSRPRARHERQARGSTGHARTQRDVGRLRFGRNRPGDAARAVALRAAGLGLAEACGMTRLCDELAETVAPPPGNAVPAESPALHVAPSPASVHASLCREVDFWTISFGAYSFQLKDTKGLAFLQTLLRHPGREFHVLDPSSGGDPLFAGPCRPASGDAGELLDPSARAAYKRRLGDLRDELEEAQRWSDLERAARAAGDRLPHRRARPRRRPGAEPHRGIGGRARASTSAARSARW